jgi:hypothetical protein
MKNKKLISVVVIVALIALAPFLVKRQNLGMEILLI